MKNKKKKNKKVKKLGNVPYVNVQDRWINQDIYNLYDKEKK